MSHFVPLSYSAYQGYAWIKTGDYHFIADQGSIALVAQELPSALATMPIGFRQAENKEYELVSICGLSNQKNLFVHSDGRWLAGYRPALLRTYPFLLKKGPDQQHVLCIDEHCGMLVDEKDGVGISFFDDSGKPGEQLNQIVKFLSQWEQQRRTTQKAINMLASFDLIIPWNVKMETADGEEMPGLVGYYRVDEKALNALSAKQLGALIQLGGLTIAYAQLFSQHRLDVLTRLYKLQQHRPDQTAAEPDLESLFDSGDDSISFDFDS